MYVESLVDKANEQTVLVGMIKSLSRETRMHRNKDQRTSTSSIGLAPLYLSYHSFFFLKSISRTVARTKALATVKLRGILPSIIRKELPARIYDTSGEFFYFFFWPRATQRMRTQRFAANFVQQRCSVSCNKFQNHITMNSLCTGSRQK